MSTNVLSELAMYGYCIAWRRKPVADERDPSLLPAWQIEQCDEYLNLPAHYPALEEAMDRAQYLRSKGLDARVVALVADPLDRGEDFDRARVAQRKPK
jgi:hypothetical protein